MDGSAGKPAEERPQDGAAAPGAGTQQRAQEGGSAAGASGEAANAERDDIGVLKSVLPIMSRHATGYHPLSYAVWFEYAKEKPGPLRADVDAELQYRERLSRSQTLAIYHKHMVEPAERAVMKVRADLLDLVGDIRRTVQDADRRTGSFDREVARFERELAAVDLPADGRSFPGIAQLRGSVASMAEVSRSASAGLARVTEMLEESRLAVAQLEEELRRTRESARTDRLSGLLNRQGFDEELRRFSVGVERNGPLAVILLDIDHFKQVNDTYGHALGDAVISKVGIVIRACCGPHIPAARSGGEEFAVLLPGQDARQARELAEEIRARVERGRIRNRKEDQDIGGITISAGVAVRRGSEEIETVLERADAALYVAKHDGRNRVAMEAPLASIPTPTAEKSPETPPI